MTKINRIAIPISIPEEYTPDGWSIISINNNVDNPFFKVFASWYGSYDAGDSYRFNSGITKVESDDNYYYFYGHSGSIYKCHKKRYNKHTSYANNIIEQFISSAKKEGVHIEIMDDTDWLNLIK